MSKDLHNIQSNIVTKDNICIVLDLDQTLVCDSECDCNYNCNCNLDNDVVNINFEDSHGDYITLKMLKRPGFDIFIKFCFSIGKVGIWSMGQPNYVKEIVKLINCDLSFVYDWRSCDRQREKIYKNLDIIPHNGNIIMIDDSPKTIKYTKTLINFQKIKRWDGNNSDTELFKMIDIIKSLL